MIERWLTPTSNSIWPLFYQTVGGAIVIPLWYLSYTWIAARTDYWTSSSEMPASKARTLLPALVLGYVLPTIACWLPVDYFDMDTIQALVAFWQVSPMVANLLWWLFSSMSSNTTTKSQQYTLGPLHMVTILVSFISHLSTLYLCTTSADPTLSLRFVFYPSLPEHASMPEAVHFIFQIDFWIICLATLVWALQGQLELISLRRTSITIPIAFSLTALGALLFGPGAVVGAVWWWREGKLGPQAAVEKKRR